MPVTTSTATPILQPAEVEKLYQLPVTQRSIAARVCKIVTSMSGTVVAPRITSTPSAAWVDEMAEIPTSEEHYDNLTIVVRKVAALVPVSSEIASRAAVDILHLVGEHLIDATAARLDEAFMTTQPAPAPQLLSTLTGHATVTVPDVPHILDAWVATTVTAADRGNRIAAWLVNPAVRTQLATVKAMTTSLQYLLTDVDQNGDPLFQGAPIIGSSHIPAGVAWAIPENRVIMAVAPPTPADVDISEHAMFSRDALVVRARFHTGFGCIDPAAVTKYTITTTP